LSITRKIFRGFAPNPIWLITWHKARWRGCYRRAGGLYRVVL